MIFTETQTPMHDQTFKEIIDTIKAYPEEYTLFKKKIDQIQESLNKIKEIV